MKRCLFYMVGYLCNNVCRYCFYTTGHLSRSTDSIRRASIERLTQQIDLVGFDSVIITGGEPLHHAYKLETFELMRSLKQRGLRVILNTSGTKLDQEDMCRLADLSLDRIDISIDSHLAEIHDEQRGRFDEAMSSLLGLLDLGCNLATTSVVTDLNASTIKETLAYFRHLGLEDCRIQPAYYPGQPFSQNVIQAIGKYGGLLNRVNLENPAMPDNAICQMGKGYFVSEPSGQITPCFHPPAVSLGNLLVDEAGQIAQNLGEYASKSLTHPCCFGGYCVSLFDIPSFWK